MGTPVPEDWPELEDAKWYCVTEDAYWDGDLEVGCRGSPFSRDSACRTGAVIKAYLAAQNQCVFGQFLVVASSPAQKKVVCITGPYDTQGECQAEC